VHAPPTPRLRARAGHGGPKRATTEHRGPSARVRTSIVASSIPIQRFVEEPWHLARRHCVKAGRRTAGALQAGALQAGALQACTLSIQCKALLSLANTGIRLYKLRSCVFYVMALKPFAINLSAERLADSDLILTLSHFYKSG